MIITIGQSGDRFYVGPPSRCHIKSSRGGNKSVVEPVIVFSSVDCVISASGVLECLESLPARDDDFHNGFISGTIVLQLQAGHTVDPNQLLADLETSQNILKSAWVPRNIYFVDDTAVGDLIPSGPYFLLGISIWDATSKGGISKVIAVPNRIYFKPTTRKPLAGILVAIKDNYALAGIKTSLQCLSFQETYGAETETAEYIRKLIDLGAVIVGKTKLTAFASSEKPCDLVDFQCPFNPRADGYQSAGGSTTGGAAAIAGYPRLDHSIGSDSNISSEYFETVGFLRRDIETFKNFAIYTLSPTLANVTQYPKRILYPKDYFPYKDAAQQRTAEGFIVMLEDSLGVKQIEISLAGLWGQNPPPEANKMSLAEFIHTSGYNPFYYDGYHEFDAFFAEHQRLFNKKVYVFPHMQYKWDLGLEISLEDRNKFITELEIFQRWFKEQVLARDNKTASTAIMLLPLGPGQPIYRDIVVPFVKQYDIDPLNLAALLQIPHLVVPIGQRQYESRVTGRTEHLPIACSIAGASGSDLMLVNLVNSALSTKGWPTEVKTGRYAFDLGSNIRNVGETGTPDTSFER